jgi:hypothetical protein
VALRTDTLQNQASSLVCRKVFTVSETRSQKLVGSLPDFHSSWFAMVPNASRRDGREVARFATRHERDVFLNQLSE